MIFKQKTDGALRVLAVGDIVGRPGRRFLKESLPILRDATQFDALVVNVENAAGGFGLTEDVYQELELLDIDCMTSGNHIFDKKGYEDWMDCAPSLLRPENFPQGSVGRGSTIVPLGNGLKLGVINIIGRTFMKPYDCPFRAVDEVLDEMRAETPLILVDFHAEATSEKMAMGWYVSRRASAFWGTHTHVPTNDFRVLENHTGFITDLGMTGPYDSVIGMEKTNVIEGFVTLGRARFDVAKKDPRLGGCLFDLDPETGRCLWLQGLFLGTDDMEQIKRAAKQEREVQVPS